MGELFDKYPALLILPEMLLAFVILGIIVWRMNQRGGRDRRDDDRS
ncbi:MULTISPECIES: hypothetical protein [Pandoraea]|nr:MULTISPECIES: hypothetical protein [Pandoraea]APR97725.1 hypothetical protein PATSB16_43910 [Pandoraea thiooxydans]